VCHSHKWQGWEKGKWEWEKAEDATYLPPPFPSLFSLRHMHLCAVVTGAPCRQCRGVICG